MQRLLLIRHARTSAVKASAFPLDEPLDARGEAAARALAGAAGRHDHALCGPSLRARSTAELLGLAAAAEPRLEECDFAAWHGQTLADVHAADPAGVEAWMTDPASAPHGGESIVDLCSRVRGWLDELAATDGRTVAVTSGGVVRAAVAVVLGAPPEATWRLDVAPLSATVLHAHDGRWTVRSVNGVLGADVRAGEDAAGTGEAGVAAGSAFGDGGTSGDAAAPRVAGSQRETPRAEKPVVRGAAA